MTTTRVNTAMRLLRTLNDFLKTQKTQAVLICDLCF